jgi:RNA polymerase sigma-70 factor (ECF subfamily)
VDEITTLAVLAREGDQVALAAFVRRTQAQVWRLCSSLAGPDQADDVTQDTYLRALGALHAYRGEASATTWLLSIARRASADAVRRNVRRRRLAARLDARPTNAPPPGAPLDLLLATLDPDRREALVLTQVLGLSYAEAAEVCACPVGTIRSRVARAREQLVDELGEREAAAGAD